MNIASSVLAIGLIVASVFALFLIVRSWKSSNPTNGSELSTILFAFVGNNAFFYLLVPSVFRLILGWESDLDTHVAPMEIVEVYMIEILSIAIWAFTLRTLQGKAISIPRSEQALPSSVERTFLGILLISAIFMNVESLRSGAALHEARGVLGASTLLSDRFLWPISTICQVAGSVVGAYVVVRGRRKSGFILWSLGLAGIAIYVLTYGLGGVRSTLIWPALWGVLLLRMYRPRLWLVAAIPPLIIVASVVVFQGGYMAMRSTDTETSLSSRVEVFQKHESVQSANVLESAEYRLGCPSRYSVGFVRMWDSGRGAYWNPILNSLYAPLPRLFFPDKPWPTSRDGDMYSAGMYLIMTELGQFDNYSMTDFLTGVHAYWEFGWIGVFFLSALTGAYSKLALWVAQRLAFAGPPLIVFFFRPWGYNNPRLWISDAIIAVVQVVPAIALVWAVAWAWCRAWSQVVSVLQEGATRS